MLRFECVSLLIPLSNMCTPCLPAKRPTLTIPMSTRISISKAKFVFTHWIDNVSSSCIFLTFPPHLGKVWSERQRQEHQSLRQSKMIKPHFIPLQLLCPKFRGNDALYSSHIIPRKIRQPEVKYLDSHPLSCLSLPILCM